MSNEIKQLTGIDTLSLELSKASTDDELYFHKLIVHGTTDLFNFYYYIANHDLIYESDEEIVYIDEVGNNQLDENSLEILTYRHDYSVQIKDEVYPCLSKLYTHKSLSSEGQLDGESIRELRNFCAKSNLYLDTFEVIVYDFSEFYTLFDSIQEDVSKTKCLLKHVKNYIFNFDLDVVLCTHNNHDMQVYYYSVEHLLIYYKSQGMMDNFKIKGWYSDEIDVNEAYVKEFFTDFYSLFPYAQIEKVKKDDE
jgi:hypothetical protein